jgi:hypothetical protein
MRLPKRLSPTQKSAIAAIREGRPVAYRVTFLNGLVSTKTHTELYIFESEFINVTWDRNL